MKGVARSARIRAAVGQTAAQVWDGAPICGNFGVV